jgi:hypothetical protein
LPYVFAYEYLANGEPAISPVYKDFSTQDLDSTSVQSFILKSIGNDSLAISVISIIGDSSFSATYNCTGA